MRRALALPSPVGPEIALDGGVRKNGVVTHDMAEVFLLGAQVVGTALADPAVAAAWDRPSVLEEQRVSGLAGHLARGGVWVLADYLDAGAPEGPLDFTSAGDYFTTLLGKSTPADHRAIRERGAEVAAPGREELLRTLGQRLEALGPSLRTRQASSLVAVTGGKVMRLGDYLATRIVEQVVHLDDLARSVDRHPWPMPEEAVDIAIAVGTDVARRRGGSLAVVRALYRRGYAEPLLPVV